MNPDDGAVLQELLDTLAARQSWCPLCGSAKDGEKVCRSGCFLEKRWQDAVRKAKWWRKDEGE